MKVIIKSHRKAKERRLYKINLENLHLKTFQKIKKTLKRIPLEVIHEYEFNQRSEMRFNTRLTERVRSQRHCTRLIQASMGT